MQSQTKPKTEAAPRRYWRLYGGWGAILSSPYFWIAAGLTGLCTPIWIERSWWDFTFAILPNLLGFSLGGFSLLIGFGSESFLNVISGDDPDTQEPSPYSVAVASFLHFILVQAAALVMALMFKALEQLPAIKPVFEAGHCLAAIAWCIGFFMSVYALVLVVATAFAAFEVATWFNDLRTHIKAQNK